jgi:hypothetical protein
MDDAVVFTKHIINTYNPDTVTPFVGADGFYHFTYLTVNTVNHKFYLGKHSTKDLNDGYVGSGTAFLRAIKKHGHLNFQHYRLQFFNNAQDAYIAEGLLITEDFIKKYKDELKVCYNLRIGGFGGGGLSEETKAKYSKASKEMWSRSEYKEKMIKVIKEMWSRPGFKEKMSKTLKESCAKPEVKEKRSKSIKESLAKPEVREKRSKERKGLWLRSEYKEKVIKTLKESLARPESREKQSKASKEKWSRPEAKEKISKSMKDVLARPEVKEKRSKSLKESFAKPEVKEKKSKALKEFHTNKEMICQSTDEKKTVCTNDVLSHLKSGWTFTQGTIAIYNEKTKHSKIHSIQKG